MDDILNNETITNAMLKTIIDVIEVDSEGNVEVRLKLLDEIGSSPMVITNFDDINSTVTKVTTVHKDVSERLVHINKALAVEVRRILDENKAERHIRGGMATKLKYSEKHRAS